MDIKDFTKLILSPYSVRGHCAPPLIKIEAWLVYFLYTKSIHRLYLTVVVYMFSIHQIYIKQNFILPFKTDVYYLYISPLHQGYDVYCVYTTHNH